MKTRSAFLKSPKAVQAKPDMEVLLLWCENGPSFHDQDQLTFPRGVHANQDVDEEGISFRLMTHGEKDRER